MEPGWIALNIVLFVGLLVLAARYFWKDRRCHLLRIVGVLLLAVFFSLEVVRIINEGKDVWNVTFTSIAPPVFLFVAYQEYLSYRWDEDHDSLKWLVGIAGLIYYSFDRIPQMTAAITYVVAAQSVWFGQMFGYGNEWFVEPSDVHWGHQPISVGISSMTDHEAPVNIILGCTGIEAIVIFVGAALATQLVRDPWLVYRDPGTPGLLRLRSMSPRERSLRVLLYAVSIVWVGNLLRNVLIVYLVDPAGPYGWDFDVVHGDLAKTMSFVILLGLAFVTFNLMPEMLDNISGIVDLVKRKSPEEREEEARRKEREKGEGKAEGKAEEKTEEEVGGKDESETEDAEDTGDEGSAREGEPKASASDVGGPGRDAPRDEV
jgi:exosortase/archaeosortase family protein